MSFYSLVPNHPVKLLSPLSMRFKPRPIRTLRKGQDRAINATHPNLVIWGNFENRKIHWKKVTIIALERLCGQIEIQFDCFSTLKNLDNV